MNKTFSVWLDLSRLCAAVLVCLHHAEQILKDHRLSLVASFGHDAVIFFFILSGFVIGFVSHQKEATLHDYAVARLARLYSVVLPALLLMCGLLGLGLILYPEQYMPFADLNWGKILLSSLFFLNETSVASVGVPINWPLWSISYEAWYYILFGLYFYLPGKRRYLLLAVAAMISGLKILVLMPLWLAGVWCYRVHGRLKTRRALGYLCIVAALGLYGWMRVAGIDDALYAWSATWFGGAQQINAWLGFSKRFLPDAVIGVLFIVMFYGFYMVREHLGIVIHRFEKPIRFAAGFTFALYLFHWPLLRFMENVTSSMGLNLLGCVAIIVVLGTITERRKSDLAAIFNAVLRRLPRIAI